MPNRNNNPRLERVDEELKKQISNIISYDLKNPDITGMISVTKVKTSPDLKYARVYITILNSKNNKATLAGLKRASGFIRSEIAKRVNLRYTPELVFEFDDSIEYGARIDSILKEVMKDIKPEEGDN